MEFQHHRDMTKESNLRADRTNLSLSREKSTFKPKSQKEKNPSNLDNNTKRAKQRLMDQKLLDKKLPQNGELSIRIHSG